MYLKRKLDNSLSVIKGLRFGYRSKKRSFHRYTATVGVGGNIGDVVRRFERLFFYLLKERGVDVLETSLILKNPPFGFKNQGDFFNSIFVLKTSMQPKQLLKYLLRVEKKFGRKRSFANAPRTLDLDIIFFDDRVMDTKDLKIPHPYWDKRDSVLIPLMDIR